MDYYTIGVSLLGRVPALLAWGIGIAVAAVMLRRGGGRAEKLFLAGACLMFFVSLAGSFLHGMGDWLIHAKNTEMAIRAYALLTVPPSVFSLAGLVCLVWGFWLRFRPVKTGEF